MSIEILKEFTKGEIIEYIRLTRGFLPIRRRDLLFARWRIMGEKLRAEYDAELARWEREKPDFKERDRLAVQFNESHCTGEKMHLLKKIESYDNALLGHIRRCRALDARQKKLDGLYRQIEREDAS